VYPSLESCGSDRPSKPCSYACTSSHAAIFCAADDITAYFASLSAYNAHLIISQTTSDIRIELNQTETLVQNIERRRLQWFGHVKCADKSGLPAKALETMVSGTRTTRGRPNKRWIENIYENIQKRGSNVCRAVKCVKDRNHRKTFILRVKTDEPKEAKQELLRPPSYVFIGVNVIIC